MRIRSQLRLAVVARFLHKVEPGSNALVRLNNRRLLWRDFDSDVGLKWRADRRTRGGPSGAASFEHSPRSPCRTGNCQSANPVGWQSQVFAPAHRPRPAISPSRPGDCVLGQLRGEKVNSSRSAQPQRPRSDRPIYGSSGYLSVASSARSACRRPYLWVWGPAFHRQQRSCYRRYRRYLRRHYFPRHRCHRRCCHSRRCYRRNRVLAARKSYPWKSRLQIHQSLPALEMVQQRQFQPQSMQAVASHE